MASFADVHCCIDADIVGPKSQNLCWRNIWMVNLGCKDYQCPMNSQSLRRWDPQNLVEISKYPKNAIISINPFNLFIAWYCVVFRQHTVSCKSAELQNPIHFNLKVYEFDGGQQSSRAAGGVSLCFCQTGVRAVGDGGWGVGYHQPPPDFGRLVKGLFTNYVSTILQFFTKQPTL